MRLSVQGLPYWIGSAFTLPSSHPLVKRARPQSTRLVEVFKKLASNGQFLDSCRQKPLFVFQSGKLNRLRRDVRKVVISSRGMAFSVASGTWG
jgi:hypothetical protein